MDSVATADRYGKTQDLESQKKIFLNAHIVSIEEIWSPELVVEAITS